MSNVFSSWFTIWVEFQRRRRVVVAACLLVLYNVGASDVKYARSDERSVFWTTGNTEGTLIVLFWLTCYAYVPATSVVDRCEHRARHSDSIDFGKHALTLHRLDELRNFRHIVYNWPEIICKVIPNMSCSMIYHVGRIPAACMSCAYKSEIWSRKACIDPS